MDSDNNNDTTGEGGVSTRVVVSILLLVVLVIMIVGPCVFSRQRRQWCCFFLRRVICRDRSAILPAERRGASDDNNSNMAEEMDEDRDVAMAAAAAVASAEALRRARAAWTKQQEEYVRSFLSTEKLLGFTMTVEEKDLCFGYLDDNKEESATTAVVITPMEVDGGEGQGKEDEKAATLDRDSSSRSLDSDTAQQQMLLGDDENEKEEEEEASPVSYILLPPPGVSKAVASGADAPRRRKVANGCAVCLGEFEVQDEVCWSSNQECPHVFHEECIMDWIVAMARRRRRTRALEGGDAADEDDDVEVGGVSKGLVKFSMLCPCCRQDFFASSTKMG